VLQASPETVLDNLAWLCKQAVAADDAWLKLQDTRITRQIADETACLVRHAVIYMLCRILHPAVDRLRGD
jgi:hypothetical protein